MSSDIERQFEELDRKRSELENRQRIQGALSLWNQRNAFAMKDLSMIQSLCHHPDKKFLGKNITGKWYKCNDCTKLIEEIDYSGF